MRIRNRKVVKKYALPAVRDGDQNVDWREVAEKLLEQNQTLTAQNEILQKEINELSRPILWSTDPNVPAGHIYILPDLGVF